MTPGFTKIAGERDLFTANHRIKRVRVLRDGVELGVEELDIDRREPQPLDVDGPGGVYRFELVELVVGTNPNWREACISELKFFGTSPSALPEERSPRIATSRRRRTPTPTRGRSHTSAARQDTAASSSRAPQAR